MCLHSIRLQLRSSESVLLFYILLMKLKSCPVKVWMTVMINESQKRFGVPESERERESFKLREDVRKSVTQFFNVRSSYFLFLFLWCKTGFKKCECTSLNSHIHPHWASLSSVSWCEAEIYHLSVWTIVTMHPSLLPCLFNPRLQRPQWRESGLDSLSCFCSFQSTCSTSSHQPLQAAAVFKPRHIPPIFARSFSLSKILVFALYFFPCARLNPVNPVFACASGSSIVSHVCLPHPASHLLYLLHPPASLLTHIRLLRLTSQAWFLVCILPFGSQTELLLTVISARLTTGASTLDAQFWHPVSA